MLYSTLLRDQPVRKWNCQRVAITHRRPVVGIDRQRQVVEQVRTSSGQRVLPTPPCWLTGWPGM